MLYIAKKHRGSDKQHKIEYLGGCLSQDVIKTRLVLNLEVRL